MIDLITAKMAEQLILLTEEGEAWARGCNDMSEIAERVGVIAAEIQDVLKQNCQHEFFKCQVPAGDSCQPIYHQVCKKCRWDRTRGCFMPSRIWRGWAVPRLEELDKEGKEHADNQPPY